MAQTKNERVKSFRVVNGYEQCLVIVVNSDKGDETALAIQEAARIWDVPWTKIAHSCEVTQIAEQWRCTCSCGKRFLSDNITSECPACINARARAVNQYMKSRPVDRRVNAKN